MTQGPAVTEVSERHRFSTERLAPYLLESIDDFGEGLSVRQFQGGASNPTFLLTTQRAGRETYYVLRKKPPGQLLASAHQVDREFKVMKALGQTDVPVPVMRCLCEDPDIIGTSFYVMDYLEGRVFRDAALPDLSARERAAVYDELNATLAKLHKVDFNAIGLGDFGKAGGYYERQLKRWTTQYRAAESEHIPEMEALIEAFPALMPKDDEASIAHGDYRLENTMFHPSEPRLIAVLDWELSTIGHPLADIAYNCFLWRSDSPSWGSLIGVDFAASGIPTEAAYLDAYCRRAGRARPTKWNVYVAFGVFRLASISQGVYRRVLAGSVANARGGDASAPVNGARHLAQQALAILEGKL
jgi:aminoglycoside phosphotransferase (APT) family kinase protein